MEAGVRSRFPSLAMTTPMNLTPRRPNGLPRLMLGLLILCWAIGARASSYDAPMPPELKTAPDLCAYAPCREVLPGADQFSQRKGKPAYVEAYRTVAGREELAGYVFLSTDIVDIPAYSGKPVVTLIGMDPGGKVAGIKILRHSEPILLVGIPEAELFKFVGQFVGKSASDKIEIGKGHPEEGVIGIDAISGATVTVIAENQVIMRSAYEIARQVGLVHAEARTPAAFAEVAEQLGWEALLREGSVQKLRIMPQEVGEPDAETPFIEIYFGYLNAPNVGRNILGDGNYQRLMRDLKPGEQAVFLAANGTSSFKGSGFVRGGIFDRFQVAQDRDSFTFRDTDYRNLYDIEAEGAPTFRESGIFILRNAAFSAAYPWQLVYLANRVDRETSDRTFVTFQREYWLPARYLVGGHPEIPRPEPTWLKIWKGKLPEIAAFLVLLALTALAYGTRDRLARRANHKDKRWVSLPKYVAWTASLVFVGFYAKAQPSITHVMTWFHSLLFQWKWELFLSDPLVFIFWWFIIASVLVWGRGLFCGWLCPYGSMTEMLFKLGRALGLRRWQFMLPRPWHDRLKWLKYAVFPALLGVSLYSMGLAERMAEVEPFKTTFLVGVWNRAWPYALFWGALLGLSLLTERPFCKYLCPLGAALAIPTTFRFFGLKRKPECRSCKACAVGCGSQAIDERGTIDPRECLLCLDCMVLYYDSHACPPLAKERKAREKAGIPLTPISAQGYFLPVQPAVPVAAEEAGSIPRPLPRMPGGLGRIPFHSWLVEEFIDHMLPWDWKSLRERPALQALGIGLAVAATIAWVLGASGHLGSAAVIGWWVGWSVYEFLCRERYKPWVKEGLWWGRVRRPADRFDLLAYVATKNLLIGAVLFLALSALGWLR
jgi:NosR/NirI family nitrous oxide reductase transcriptional regulator